MKTLIALLTALAAVTLAGCDKSEQAKLAPKKTDFGTGLNAVEKMYDVTPTRLFEVVTASLQSYDLTVESDKHDDLGGEIVARRADGSKVTAKVTARDEASSEVSIRVAPGNKNLAEMIHTRIAEKVGAMDVK
jgi:hypothetical protein